MTKLGEQQLATHVRDELVSFLRNGTINERQVAKTLDITDLEIENLDRLKRIHFCLSDPVVEFVDQLQDRLRRIKTANRRQRVTTRGEVRGRVDWQETTRLRYSESVGDRSRFACETPYTEYDIPENLVLKKLLWTIHTTVNTDLSEIDYEWRTNKWPSERIADFNRLYARNVHLSRIRDGADTDITPRMLTTTRAARQPLYTKSYELYDRYQRLLTNESDSDVEALLRDTLIVPERLPKLFELFCVFQLLRKLDFEGLKLRTIEPGAEMLAQMETGDRRVNVFHDRTGSLSFHVALDDIEEVSGGYFERHRRTIERHKELADAFLDIDSRKSLYSGRPDIVIELYDKTRSTDIPSKVILGEIKYTTNKQTFSKGLKELLEYVEFAQKEGYLRDAGTQIQGLIITDGVETEQKSPLDETVTHLTASDLLDNGTAVDNRWLTTS